MTKKYFLQAGSGMISLLLVVALIAIGGAVYLLGRPTVSPEEGAQSIRDDIKAAENVKNMLEGRGSAVTHVMEEGDAMEKGEEMVEKNATYVGTILAGISAPLLDFREADYEAAQKTDKLIVLYFYADWCPICRAEFPKMQAAFNELTSADVIGFRVNYKDNFTDSAEEALAREFGIGYQHTKVFVRRGERLLKAPDGWEKARYLSEINARLE